MSGNVGVLSATPKLQDLTFESEYGKYSSAKIPSIQYLQDLPYAKLVTVKDKSIKNHKDIWN